MSNIKIVIFLLFYFIPCFQSKDLKCTSSSRVKATKTRIFGYEETTYDCGEVGIAYAPCKMIEDKRLPFPGCCPQLDCPPYFTYFDAYMYTYSLIISGGTAPLIQGKYRPNYVVRVSYKYLDIHKYMDALNNPDHDEAGWWWSRK